jgi:Phytochelatin synthase
MINYNSIDNENLHVLHASVSSKKEERCDTRSRYFTLLLGFLLLSSFLMYHAAYSKGQLDESLTVEMTKSMVVEQTVLIENIESENLMADHGWNEIEEWKRLFLETPLWMEAVRKWEKFLKIESQKSDFSTESIKEWWILNYMKDISCLWNLRHRLFNNWDIEDKKALNIDHSCSEVSKRGIKFNEFQLRNDINSGSLDENLGDIGKSNDPNNIHALQVSTSKEQKVDNTKEQIATLLELDRNSLVYLNTSRSFQILTDGGKYSQDYFLIQQGFDSQINQAYCGVATCASLLNSLRGQIELPIDPIYNPYAYATQFSIFNNCTNSYVIHQNASFDGILAAPYGLGMEQIHAILRCHLDTNSWNVSAYHLDPEVISFHQFRRDLQNGVTNLNSRVIINYDRKSVGQVGGGHWSLIGAYSHDLDSFLVMDVAKYKYPNAWIPSSLLYQSLQTWDLCGNWNFPAAQGILPPDYLYSKTVLDYFSATAMLGCSPMRRGYIIIQKLSEQDDVE